MNLEVSSLDASPILVLPIGDFGLAAANHLKRLLPQVTILDGDTQGGLSALANNASAVAVLIAWRPMRAVSEAMDERAYRTGTASCSLVLQDHEMIVGPLVVPGFTNCWRCWDTRALQADPVVSLQAAKRSFYANHPESGPSGYMPSLALLGAAQLAKALESLRSDGDHAGAVLRTDLFTRQITKERAIGLDSCDRCGLQRPLASRSYAQLQASLRTFWSKDKQSKP